MEKLVVKKFSDVGTGELFMSRLRHFDNYVLSGLFGLQNKAEISTALWSVIFDGLEPAYRSLKTLRSELGEESVVEQKRKQDIENVISYLIIAYKDRFQYVVKLLDYDIGFLFLKKETGYQSGCKQFIKDHPDIGARVIEMLNQDRSLWLRYINDCRNDLLEHKAGKDPITIKKLARNVTPENLKIAFDNCWKSIEDMLAIFVDAKTDQKYGMELRELGEYKRNNEHPTRFEWVILAKEVG